MKEVKIALWRPNYIDKSAWLNKPNEPLDELDRALEEASNYWGCRQPSLVAEPKSSPEEIDDSKVIRLFLAPEYLFTGDLSKHFMSEHQYYGLLFGLKYLSSKYPDIVIVPGSIGWFKNSTPSKLCSEEDDGKPIHNPLQKLKKGAEDINRPTRDHAYFVQNILGFKPAPELLSSLESKLKTEWSDDQKLITALCVNCNFDASERLSYIRQLELRFKSFMDEYKGNDLKNCKLAFNTAIVLQHGKVVHSYNKIAESIEDPIEPELSDGDASSKVSESEVLVDIPTDNDTLFFCPGTKSPFFNIDGVSFGLEICADHTFSTLRTATIKQAKKIADIHLLTSEWVDNFYGSVAGRYLVHASTRKEYHGVFTKQKEDIDNEFGPVDDLSDLVGYKAETLLNETSFFSLKLNK